VEIELTRIRSRFAASHKSSGDWRQRCCLDGEETGTRLETFAGQVAMAQRSTGRSCRSRRCSLAWARW